MHREVRICSLGSNVADRMFAKQTSFHGGVLSSQTTSENRYAQGESERAEAMLEDALMEELCAIAIIPQLCNDYIRQVSDSVRNNNRSSCLSLKRGVSFFYI
jgi:hypothetical protein